MDNNHENSSAKKRFSDIFIRNEKFPNSDKILSFNFKNINDTYKDCIFVLDTNVLLLPYQSKQKSIDAIKSVYIQLIKSKKLFLPAQTLREFADNRGNELKRIYEMVSAKTKIELVKPNFNHGELPPIIKSLNEYQDLLNIEKEITEIINEKLNVLFNKYKNSTKAITKLIEDWRWNDPVSKMYKELFTNENIIELDDFEKNKNQIETQLKKRYEHKIAPGYQDENKPDLGIGDYLIWLSIIQIGKKSNNGEGANVIFITHDSKNDWFDISNKTRLYPKFELCYEFATQTNGKSFNIIKLSELLSFFQIEEKVIKEVQSKENSSGFVIIDISSINKLRPTELISIHSNSSFQSLLNDIYSYILHGIVPAFTYGKNWILLDMKNNIIIPADKKYRNLELNSLGIFPKSELKIELVNSDYMTMTNTHRSPD